MLTPHIHNEEVSNANKSTYPLSRNIDNHLARAKELDVSLEEYAAAYHVDLTLLTDRQASLDEDASTQLSSNDFVKLDIATVKHPTKVVCCLSHPSGWTLQCNDWPPATWLESLESKLRS